MGITYATGIDSTHLNDLAQLDIEIVDVLESINSVLIGIHNPSIAQTLVELNDVVMVHHYGSVVFYGDIQTPNVKHAIPRFILMLRGISV